MELALAGGLGGGFWPDVWSGADADLYSGHGGDGRFTLFRQASPKARFGLIALIPFALLALFQTPMMASIFSTDKAYAFDVRYISTMKAIAFWVPIPCAGSLARARSARSILGDDDLFQPLLFLADITWMGVIFEFGLVGAILIMALPLRGIWMMQRLRARGHALNGALQDYLIYCVLVSEMFPLTMAPGEVTMIMAIAVWRLEKLWRPKPLWRRAV
jgi:hypothetical protein